MRLKVNGKQITLNPVTCISKQKQNVLTVKITMNTQDRLTEYEMEKIEENIRTKLGHGERPLCPNCVSQLEYDDSISRHYCTSCNFSADIEEWRQG